MNHPLSSLVPFNAPVKESLKIKSMSAGLGLSRTTDELLVIAICLIDGGPADGSEIVLALSPNDARTLAVHLLHWGHQAEYIEDESCPGMGKLGFLGSE
jgi:hypothetical protein